MGRVGRNGSGKKSDWFPLNTALYRCHYNSLLAAAGDALKAFTGEWLGREGSRGRAMG